MGSGATAKIEGLINVLMAKVAEVAEEEDWKEADGWVGRWKITGEEDGEDVERVYEIRDGRFLPCNPQQHYTGEVEMSQDTFVDLVDAALHGRGEDVFADKYAMRAIRYRGAQWVVDSERFRKVLRRLSLVRDRRP